MALFGITYLTTDEAVKYSEIYLPLLAKVEDIAGGRWELSRCYDDIKNGNLTVWLIVENQIPIAALTTRIIDSKIRYLQLEDIGGERLPEWIDLLVEKTELFARLTGCKQMVMGGRVGWEKYFKRFGFEKTRVEGVKHIGDL